MKLEMDRKRKRTGSLSRFLSLAMRGAAVILALCIVYGGLAQKRISDSIVRLHIIASSDNTADQDLKLKVRDAIIDHMQSKYPGGSSR